MTDEREFPPDPDETPDTDEVETTTPTGASARVGRRRVYYFSETVQRDGGATELTEVVSIDDDPPDEPGIFGDAPDRAHRPYQWERFWRGVMRSSAPPASRWHGSAPWGAVEWHCQACGLRIEDVQATGRPPRFCQRPECQRARAVARQRRHRNVA